MEKEIVYIKKVNNDLTTIDAVYGQQSIGYINYSIKSDRFGRNAWLYKVAVSEKFRGQGVGGSLLKIMENDCALARVWSIEGKYYPEGASNEEVSSFYKKHGFEIYKDGYETLVGKTSPTRQNLSGLNIKEDMEMKR